MALTIAQAVKKLLIKEPFYGLFLLSLNKRFDNSIKTACVCKNGINVELLINKEFGDSLTELEEIAILTHECLHIVMGHLTENWKCFPNHNHLNIAMDCEINCYIENLPDGAVKHDKFNLPPKMGTKFYYENIPQDEDKNYSSLDEHNWSDFEDLSDAEKTLIKNQIDHIAKNAAEQTQKMCGSIPGHLQEYITNLFKQKERVFNGKAYFKRVVGNSIKSYIKSTKYRPSFRFKGQPGNCLKFKPKVLVAIDTSGSINNKELNDFFSEVYHIYKSGVHVEVVEFDTIIQNKFVYKGDTDIKISGRGGTDMTEVYKYYVSHPEFSTLVIFTDGYLNIEYPRHRNMIWIITSDGRHQDYPGITIYIPKSNINETNA